ncbi:hypothetical protein BB561_001754 [Smittium simulii]|uniref:RRM domain-containing protein n=1 Tax=Smittium simulii TaxID=133385 RepID=A0A2T9YTE1_9FUNG|nr:hypothetical protein BB561_001754 [Smittium simulii]
MELPPDTATSPPIEPEPTIETYRLYIKGLHDAITCEDLVSRFSSFGTIENPFIPLDSIDNKPKGFGFITLISTKKQYQKCISLYNGTKWKGSTMLLEQAKQDYLEKLKNEQNSQLEASRPTKRKNPAFKTVIANDMTLVNDKNVDGKKGWKRGRYGRAVAVIKYSTPDGTLKTIDPLLYKNNLEKLYGLSNPISLQRTLNDDHEDSVNHQNFAQIDQVLENDLVDSDLKKELELHLKLAQSIPGSLPQTQDTNSHQNHDPLFANSSSDSDTDIEALYSNPSKKKKSKTTESSDRKAKFDNNLHDIQHQTNQPSVSDASKVTFDQSNFKGLFFGENRSSYKLFGSNSEEDSANPEKPISNSNTEVSNQLESSMPSENHNTQNSDALYTDSKPLFFDHFGNKNMFARSRLYPLFFEHIKSTNESLISTDSKPTVLVHDFVCTSTEKEIDEYWDKSKLVLIRDYKKKLKHAKNQQSRRRKIKFNPRRNK